MAMEDLDITYDDPRAFGRNRFARSHDRIKSNFEKLRDSLNIVRWGHGVDARIESPAISDFAIVSYNHTGRDLLFGALLSVIVAPAPCTIDWNLQQGPSLAALVDISGSDFVTTSLTVGDPVAAADLDALDPWETGNFLTITIKNVVGVPSQFFFRGVINS